MPFDLVFTICARGAAQRRAAPIDELGIRKADRDVASGRTELLEVSRHTNAHEGIVRLLSIQGVGLDPFLTSAYAIRAAPGFATTP